MRILILLEDTPNDQHVAVPLVRALCQQRDIIAKVAASHERLGSVEEAMNPERLIPIIEIHQGMVDLFILIVDRDCRAPGRPRGGDRGQALAHLPDAGFVLHDAPATSVSLQEARARNNLVLEPADEPPEAATEHRIRAHLGRSAHPYPGAAQTCLLGGATGSSPSIGVEIVADVVLVADELFEVERGWVVEEFPGGAEEDGLGVEAAFSRLAF